LPSRRFGGLGFGSPRSQVIDPPAGDLVGAAEVVRIDVGVGHGGDRLVDVVEDDHAVVEGEAEVGQAAVVRGRVRQPLHVADRVVGRVDAGGEVRLEDAEFVHEVIEPLQGLRWRQLEHGQRLDRGPQPAHGHGGPDAVTRDVADDEGDPAARQRDRLVPVAAYLDQLAAGQVAVPDLDRCGS